MTICREWLLVNQSTTEAQAKPLECKSWGCEYCNPKRRRKLIAQVMSGQPVRFITLTCNPAYLSTPEERHRSLTASWKLIVKRLRRRFPKKEVEYFAITEATERGEPHLHIVGRFPFVPQSLLSEWMGELANAPIVDIRAIKNARDVVTYVAKYITKAPAQFGTAKRYWSSQGYEVDPPDNRTAGNVPTVKWEIMKEDVYTVLRNWRYEFWIEAHSKADLRRLIYSEYLAEGDWYDVPH